MGYVFPFAGMVTAMDRKHVQPALLIAVIARNAGMIHVTLTKHVFLAHGIVVFAKIHAGTVFVGVLRTVKSAKMIVVLVLMYAETVSAVTLKLAPVAKMIAVFALITAEISGVGRQKIVNDVPRIAEPVLQYVVMIFALEKKHVSHVLLIVVPVLHAVMDYANRPKIACCVLKIAAIARIPAVTIIAVSQNLAKPAL